MKDIKIHQDLIYILFYFYHALLLHREFFLESRNELLHDKIDSTPNIEYYFIVWTMLHYYIWEECPTYVILTCHCRRICPRNNNLILLSSDPSCTGLFQDQKPSWPKIKVEKAVSSKIEDNPSGGWKHESSRYKINS